MPQRHLLPTEDGLEAWVLHQDWLILDLTERVRSRVDLPLTVADQIITQALAPGGTVRLAVVVKALKAAALDLDAFLQQGPGETLPGTVDADTGRGSCDAEGQGDLISVEVLPGEEGTQLAVLVVQGVEGTSQGGCLLRFGATDVRQSSELLRKASGEGRLSLLTSPLVGDDLAGYSVKPGQYLIRSFVEPTPQDEVGLG